MCLAFADNEEKALKRVDLTDENELDLSVHSIDKINVSLNTWMFPMHAVD